MMSTNSNLNASIFAYSQLRKDAYFEVILARCVDVYNTIIGCGIQLSNDENVIRDKFLDYLQNLNFKIKYELKNLKFDAETRENMGRADLRVLPIKDEYINDDAYYVIECKRLDVKNTLGTTGLNAEYIKNGICRFVTDYYTAYYGCNAMFGFVVEKMDINENIGNINMLLPNNYTNQQGDIVNAKTIQPLTHINLANGYLYSYISKHGCVSNKELVLYHLMFDFSQNIQ
ncbi:MAG: hypothetical protein ACI392_03850 [Paludibacteraceae bacterium]